MDKPSSVHCRVLMYYSSHLMSAFIFYTLLIHALASIIWLYIISIIFSFLAPCLYLMYGQLCAMHRFFYFILNSLSIFLTRQKLFPFIMVPCFVGVYMHGLFLSDIQFPKKKKKNVCTTSIVVWYINHTISQTI